MTSRKKITTNKRGTSYNLSSQNTLSTRNIDYNNSNNSSSSINKRKLSAIDLEADSDNYNYEYDDDDTGKDKSEDFARLESLILGNEFIYYIFTMLIYCIYLIIDKFYNNRNGW